MRKLFIESVSGEIITLKEDEHKHLSIVLRAKIGENITVCDKNGANYSCEITKFGKNETQLRVLEVLEAVNEPNIDCTLFFGALKGDGNDLVVRHAVELGVAQITPFVSEFTVAQNTRIDRLSKIALEAGKQCGRSKIPPINPQISFLQLAESLENYDIILFFYERATEKIADFLAGKTGKKVAVIVGSEGGFSEAEASILMDRGVVPLSMGSRILKAETAATVALAITMHESGNL